MVVNIRTVNLVKYFSLDVPKVNLRIRNLNVFRVDLVSTSPTIEFWL